MRENKRFGQRKVQERSREVIKKVYLVFEGKKTEPRYFQALDDKREELGINKLIQLVPLIRSFSEEGWSNPAKITGRVIEHIKEKELESLTYRTIVDTIIEQIKKEQDNISENVLKELRRHLVLEGNIKCESELIEKAKVQDVCCSLVDKLSDLQIALIELDMLKENITDSALTYDKDVDKICVIVDRDPSSFTEEQYDEVVRKCQEWNMELYISNPCFEFWLLLHFDEVKECNEDDLLENVKISNKHSYISSKLIELTDKFTKSNFNTDIFMDNIDKAIKNEREYCEDVLELKYSLGSSIGVLINSVRD